MSLHHLENHPPPSIYLCLYYQGWRETWSCPPRPLCRMFWRSWTELGSTVVILGSLSAEFICHGWHATPEGRLDTLHWLSLPQSISVFSLSPYLQLMSAPLPPTHQHFLLLAFAVSVLYRNLHTHALPLFVSLCSTEPGPWTSYKGHPPELAMQCTGGSPYPFSDPGYTLKCHMQL